MSKSDNEKRLDRILRAAEAHFRAPVQRVTAPGGEGRASYRLHFENLDVIATLRPNFRRTHLEGFVLSTLADHCDDAPKNLGIVGEIMFQSDVGDRRLNVEIMNHEPDRQTLLAAEAVDCIFRIHAAARQTDLHTMLPHLGNNAQWVENFVFAVDAMQSYAGGIDRKFDRDAVCEVIAQPGVQFIKWDCRSGNAAISDDGQLRWFDFEYCGLRHGAEDFAWLVGDEAWPLSPELMEEIIKDRFDPACGHEWQDYLDYLSIYLTFHCVQRFKLIVKESRKRGWLSKQRVRRFDDAGLHPDFAAQVCEVARYFAAKTRLTAPLVRNFEAARDAFAAMEQHIDLKRSA